MNIFLKALLKYKYKRLYLKLVYYKRYDCGHILQLAIDPRYYKLCKSFNATADKLAKVDPSCPPFRYEIE